MKVKNILIGIAAALAADLAGFMAAAFAVRLIFSAG